MRASAVAPTTQVFDVEIALGSAALLRDPEGRPQPPGPVLEDRKRMADDAQRIYGPRPRLIEVR